MMDYKQMADIVIKEGDAILEQKKKRAMCIRRISFSVSGLCAAAIVGAGIWHMNDIKQLPNNRFSEIDIPDEITATTTASTDAAITTSMQTTSTFSERLSSTQTTSEKTTKHTGTTTTVTSKIQTTLLDNIQTAVHTTQTASVVTSKVTTSINDVSETTSMEGNPVTTSKYDPPTPVTTSKQTSQTTISSVSQTTITTVTSTTINIQDSFRSSPCRFRLNGNRYEKEGSRVNEDNIGGFIKKVPVNIKCVERQNYELTEYMEVYEMQDVSIDEAVAVKLKDTDEYYLFKNKEVHS